MSNSILSFPERGPWGDKQWRGNCSGYVYKEMFEQLRPASFCDPMAGSGTSIEVAREMGIEAYGLDLRFGFDAMTDSILAQIGQPVDLIVSHPPYGPCIKYSGPGGMWGDVAHPSDLSHCESDEDFYQKMQAVMLNERDATKGGGYYGTIIGDYRKDGRYRSYQAEVISRLPRDELAAVLIKAQHNEQSSRKSYGRMPLWFIQHEYILLFQKPRKVMSQLALLANIAKGQHAALKGTWRSVVRQTMGKLGGKASLKDLYAAIAEDCPAQIADRAHWREKVRQTLQLAPEFVRLEQGVWAIQAMKHAA